MKVARISLLLFLSVSACLAQPGFKQSQLEYSRVRSAYEEMGDSVRSMLSGLHLHPGNIELYIRVFKLEKEFEIWVRKKGDIEFSLLNEYPVCTTSGTLGPKRREGDLQIPEGFYRIGIFNPWSNFHLSMCIDYPNRSDRILGMQGNLGGNICIHGSCVTIGCIPLTDAIIKPVYLLCVEARNNGQEKIPVSIYPARLNPMKFKMLNTLHGDDPDKVKLWADLHTAYEFFQEHRRLPKVIFLADGRHRFE